MLPVPPILIHWLAPFAAVFTKPTWERVLVLVAGAVLAPGRRSVTAVLSVLGRRIGIGGHLTVPPLPHHRAYGSRTRAVRSG